MGRLWRHPTRGVLVVQILILAVVLDSVVESATVGFGATNPSPIPLGVVAAALVEFALLGVLLVKGGQASPAARSWSALVFVALSVATIAFLTSGRAVVQFGLTILAAGAVLFILYLEPTTTRDQRGRLPAHCRATIPGTTSRRRDGLLMILRKVLTAAGVTVVVLAAVLASPATRTSAGNVLDMRGTWHWVSDVGAAQYPQTLSITNEDLNTGAFSGSDSGGGSTYSAQGGVSGNVASVTLAGHGYTARSTGTVSSSGGGLSWSGTFTDSQGVKGGTFNASMTGGGGAASPPSNTASARPATPTTATTPSGNDVVTSSPLAVVAPTTAGSNNGGGGFPVLPVAAVAAAVAMAAALAWAVMAQTASADAWRPWVNRGTGPLLKPGGGAPEAGPNYGGPGATYTPDRPLDLKLPEAGPNYGGPGATYTPDRPLDLKPPATTLDGPPPASYDLKPTDPSATPPGYDSSPSIPPQTPTENP